MTNPVGSTPADAGAERNRLLGAFARIYVRDSAEALAEAFVADQLVQVQLNLSALGFPTIPTAQELADLDTEAIKAAFASRGRVIWGVSATYNIAHPDRGVREETTNQGGVFHRQPRCTAAHRGHGLHGNPRPRQHVASPP